MNTHSSYNSNYSNSPIILLHGWGMNKNIWLHFIQTLPSEIKQRIVCLDLPGFGENLTELNPYNLTALADWLGTEITEPSIVVGWSLGGLVAQQLAISNPGKIEKLVLVASSPKFMAEDDWMGIKPDVLTMFAAQLTKDHIKTIERFLAIQAMGSATAKQDIKTIKQAVLSAPSPTMTSLVEGLNILQNADVREAYRDIQIPIHLVFGRLDSLVPNAAIQQIHKLNQNAQIRLFDKASHAPFISHLEDFSKWFEQTVN